MPPCRDRNLSSTRWLATSTLVAPKLSMTRSASSGSVYSSNPRDRLLILNGRPFQEGESPAPEVTLEEIRLKSAVLRYRNHRYTINY